MTKYMTVCQNLRCCGNGTILTGFTINTDNIRCEACGNVAAALAQIKFESPYHETPAIERDGRFVTAARRYPR